MSTRSIFSGMAPYILKFPGFVMPNPEIKALRDEIARLISTIKMLTCENEKMAGRIEVLEATILCRRPKIISPQTLLARYV